MLVWLIVWMLFFVVYWWNMKIGLYWLKRSKFDVRCWGWWFLVRLLLMLVILFCWFGYLCYWWMMWCLCGRCVVFNLFICWMKLCRNWLFIWWLEKLCEKDFLLIRIVDGYVRWGDVCFVVRNNNWSGKWNVCGAVSVEIW